MTVEQLLNGDRVEALAAFSLNEHCAMIEKVEAEEICKAEFSDEHVENLGELLRHPSQRSSHEALEVISQAGVQENVVKFHGANDGAVGSSPLQNPGSLISLSTLLSGDKRPAKCWAFVFGEQIKT